MTYTIAVDFDGTLHDGKTYPNIGKPIEPVLDYVQRKKSEGACIILWTCRTGTALDEAVKWCEKQGLTFDYVNENSDERKVLYGTDPRKIGADEYIDDKAINTTFIQWNECLAR